MKVDDASRAITLIQNHLGIDALEQAEAGGPLTVRAKLEEMLGDLNRARRTWQRVFILRKVQSKNLIPVKHDYDTIRSCLRLDF